MKPWKKYLILGLAFLLLVKVLSCRLVDYDFADVKESCKPMADTVEISAAEVERFLPLWAEYMSNGLNTDVSDKISLLSGDLETALPWKVSFWLQQHCWTATRFYYVEQRLRAIIRTLYLQEHTRAVKAILSEQMEREDDDARKAAYQNMIDMQDKIAGIEAVSDNELLIVHNRVQLIDDVLNGKAIYKKNEDQ